MIGIARNIVTVQKLYDYAVLHNYLNTDVKIVLDIISREQTIDREVVSKSRDFNKDSIINSADNTNTIEFTNHHYTIQEVMELFSS